MASRFTWLKRGVVESCTVRLARARGKTFLESMLIVFVLVWCSMLIALLGTLCWCGWRVCGVWLAFFLAALCEFQINLGGGGQIRLVADVHGPTNHLALSIAFC